MFTFVEYKDPWLRDTTDQAFHNAPYGYGNLGMEAPFKQEHSSFRPTVTSKYRGAFLNQGNPPFGDQPYYSVGTPSPQQVGGYTSHFVYWTGIQNAAAAQTGVVFQQSGATATAQHKAHLYSTTADAVTPRSQTHVVYGNVLPGMSTRPLY